jgi:hypothetical protein
MSEADGQTDVFEYLMAKLIEQHLWESMNPQRVRLSGKKSLKPLTAKAQDVIAILALHGSASGEDAETAFQAGNRLLETETEVSMPQIEDWDGSLDKALPALDLLKPADKQKLVNALIATVMADNRIAVAEMELLRVVCSVIHVPLPMITGGETV